MQVKINIITDGFDCFYDLFNTQKRLSRKDIEELFNKHSYEKLVNLFGNNVGLPKKVDWIELFMEAYSLYLSSLKIETKDIIKRNILGSILWALHNKSTLPNYVKYLTEIINQQQFIQNALEYLPNINSDIDINLYYYIFMNNACVEEDSILLDISFASQLTEEQLNDLLAHELHHYLKRELKESYERPKEGYEDITQSLFALENEGIADMCSFEGLSFIYENLGFAEKGYMLEIINNSIYYMTKFGQILNHKLVFDNDLINVYSFLMENQKIHPLGYVMASQISDTLGIEELRSCVGDPLRFVITYHNALKQISGKNFLDDKAIRCLSSIYKRSITF